jgi:hypothetical protein
MPIRGEASAPNGIVLRIHGFMESHLLFVTKVASAPQKTANIINCRNIIALSLTRVPIGIVFDILFSLVSLM